MAANRSEGLSSSITKIYSNGGIQAFWRGLIPWAWIEASTKGAVLLFTASELEYYFQRFGFSKAVAGIMGGCGGGVAQGMLHSTHSNYTAYTTMGFCTFMKTVEVTRHRNPGIQKSTWAIAADIFKKEGIIGINK